MARTSPADRSPGSRGRGRRRRPSAPRPRRRSPRRGWCCAATQARSPSRSPRPACTAPWLSQAITRPTPAATSSRTTAWPPGPRPATTTVASARRLPATDRPLESAASTAAAVPCWSSWNTGMSRRSSSSRWTSKQRGAEMSLRWMPANTEEQQRHGLGDLGRVAQVHRQREGVDAGQLVQEDALAPRGRAATPGAEVALAHHRAAVAHDHHAVALDGVVPGLLEVVVDRHAHAGHAGRVGHREVVAGGDRHAVLHAHLAAGVRQEDPVEDRLHRPRPRRPRRRRGSPRRGPRRGRTR